MTGTLRATASSMAPVSLPASEQETRIAVAPSLTACAMRWAWIWPSSVGGVSHTISIGCPIFPDRSRAAVSAPRRADRKIGFVELFAIIAMRIGLPAERVASAAAPAGTLDERQPAASAPSASNTRAARFIVDVAPPGGAQQSARWPGRGPPR